MAPAAFGTLLRHIQKVTAGRGVQQYTDRQLLDDFATRRDEAAFAVLVSRHGPMVLQVCRRVLNHEQDAEDAFQATFLVLAQNTGSIRKRDTIGNWLHGVAYRTALKAKRSAARRRNHEARIPASAPPIAARPSWDDVQAVLDEEVQRLPARFREAFVLCVLEGKSGSDAAVELACKEGTVKSRVSRARQALQRQLARRGISLAALLAAQSTSETAGQAGMSPVLAQTTIHFGLLVAAGEPAAGVIPAHVAALAAGVTRAMFLTKAKIALAVLFAVSLIAAAAGVLAQRQPVGNEPAPPPAAPSGKQPAAQAKPSPENDKDAFTYSGRVLGPDGKPLSGAKLFVWFVDSFREWGVSGPDGTFRFCVRRDQFGDNVPRSWSPPERHVLIAATADGYGAACVAADRPDRREQQTLWLPAEEIVRGRIVDLQGKPVAGVKVSAIINHGRSDKEHRPLPYDAPVKAGQHMVGPLPYDRTTGISDKDGRFTLRGLSRGWLYKVFFSGPTVVNAAAQLAARPQKPSVAPEFRELPPDWPGPRMQLYGSAFTHVAAPCKPIRGMVREKGSGKPLAGVEISRPTDRYGDPDVRTTSDKDGRYTLTGLPGGIHTLKAEPPPNTPYVATQVRVSADEPGIEPVTFDIALERQPAATGRVIDRATGRPVQAKVEFRPLARSPSLKANPLLAGRQGRHHVPSGQTDRDGRFTLPVLPGPGVLLVAAEKEYTYQPARLAPADRVAGVADATDPELIDCRPFHAWPGKFHAYRLIDVAKGKDINLEIALTPASTIARSLVVEFPDGKPRETTVLGLKPIVDDRGEQYDPAYSTVVGLASDETRRLFLSTHDGQFAAALVVHGKETDPIRVQLKPTGTITGRVVDRNSGRPIAGVRFPIFYDDGPGRPGVFFYAGFVQRSLTKAEIQRQLRTQGYSEGVEDTLPQKTDDQGRFRLTWVLPDVAFDLKAQFATPPDAKGRQFILGEVKIARPTVKPGEVLDLGDLRAVVPPTQRK